MALYLKQNDTRSELQKRVAAELQAKAKQDAEAADLPDGVTDSQFIKGTTATGRFAWIWVLAIVLIVVGLISLIVATAR
jgi:hypothetical protein